MDLNIARLTQRQRAAEDELKSLEEARTQIETLAARENRDYTDEEERDFRDYSEQIKTLSQKIEGYQSRVRELAEEAQQRARIAEGSVAVSRAIASVREGPTYQKGDTRQSYLQDVLKAEVNRDPSAQERLRRHQVDIQEQRALDRDDGDGGYHVPPVWLVEQSIALARAARVTANLVRNVPLPAGTDSINIPKIATGTVAAIQTGDNVAIANTDLTDTFVNAPVKTIAGQQNVALQLLDQSPAAFDQIVFADLAADHAVKLNYQVLAGAGASGQVQGISGTSNINTVTQSAATIAAHYNSVAKAIQDVNVKRYMPPTVVVMHPRRWAYLSAALDTSGRPLFVPAAHGPQNATGVARNVEAEGFVGTVQGLSVFVDPGIRTNVSSNQDLIYVMKADDLVLWESGIRTRVLPEVGFTTGTLTVGLQLYSYLAFTAARYPQSITEIAGSGLATVLT